MQSSFIVLLAINLCCSQIMSMEKSDSKSKFFTFTKPKEARSNSVDFLRTVVSQKKENLSEDLQNLINDAQTSKNINKAINENKDTVLHEVVRRNSDPKITEKLLIELKADPNQTNKSGQTALHIAAEFQPSLISSLIQAGANVNARDKEGKSPLFYAKSIEAVNVLLKASAHINAIDKNECSVLHNAIKNRQVNVAKALMANHALIEAQDNEKRTPLHCAAQYCDELIEPLIALGADIEAQDTKGLTPLHLASSSNLNSVKKLLDEGGNIEAQNRDKETPIFCALDNLEILQLLLSKGANISHKNLINWSAEDKACFSENQKAQGLLAKYKVKALHYATLADGEQIKNLMSRKFNINDKDEEGATPLHYAIKNLDSLKNFLQFNPNLNAQDNLGRTALHLAAELYPESFYKLVLAGAELQIKDNLGQSAFEYAIKNSETLKLIFEHNVNFNEFKTLENFLALIAQYPKTLKMLIESNKVDINSRDKNGATILHYAAQFNIESLNFLLKSKANETILDNEGLSILHYSIKNNLNAVKLMLEFGLDINSKSHNGTTCLHLAAMLNPNLIDFCIENGLNINIRDNQGLTALHYAAEHNPNSIKKLLLQKADIDGKDAIGKTPLHYAAKYNAKSVSLLLENGANLDALDNLGANALYYATKHNQNAQTIILATNSKQEIHSAKYSKFGFGRTYLHFLILNSIFDKIEIVLEKLNDYRANKNLDYLILYEDDEPLLAKDLSGASPIHYAACSMNALKIILKYVKDKSFLECRDDKGNTPLHYAAYKHPDAIELLLEKGANIDAKNNYGKTPIEIAFSIKNDLERQRSIEILVKHNAKLDFSLKKK